MKVKSMFIATGIILVALTTSAEESTGWTRNFNKGWSEGVYKNGQMDAVLEVYSPDAYCVNSFGGGVELRGHRALKDFYVAMYKMGGIRASNQFEAKTVYSRDKRIATILGFWSAWSGDKYFDRGIAISQVKLVNGKYVSTEDTWGSITPTQIMPNDLPFARDFVEAIESGNTSRIVSIYEKNATFVPPGAPALTSTEKIEKYLSKMNNTYAKWKFSGVSVMMSDRQDSASVIWNYKATKRNSVEEMGYRITHFRKHNNVWLIFYDAWAPEATDVLFLKELSGNK